MDNEIVTFEDRAYLQPETSRDEQLQFIDTLRESQARNTAKIQADTYALGAQLPSNMGGLGGAENTFVAQYQTPQTNQTIANLRTAAQASALNTALSNLQNAWKKRYNDAVLNYQKRSAASSGGGSGGDSETNKLPINTNQPEELGVRTNPTGSEDAAAVDEIMNQVVQEQNSNNFAGAQSVPFMYKVNGDKVYGTIHRDALGRVTGISTPEADYNSTTGIQELLRLSRDNNFYNVQGQQLRDYNALFGI